MLVKEGKSPFNYYKQCNGKINNTPNYCWSDLVNIDRQFSVILILPIIGLIKCWGKLFSESSLFFSQQETFPAQFMKYRCNCKMIWKVYEDVQVGFTRSKLMLRISDH